MVSVGIVETITRQENAMVPHPFWVSMSPISASSRSRITVEVFLRILDAERDVTLC